MWWAQTKNVTFKWASHLYTIKSPLAQLGMVVGASPSRGDQRPLNNNAQASAISNEPHDILVSQFAMSDHSDVGGAQAEESPAPLEKADIMQNQALMMAMCSTGQP